jgi:hypothetical protein
MGRFVLEIINKVSFFLFQLQEEQYQHAEAVRSFEKMESHLQRYNLKQHKLTLLFI